MEERRGRLRTPCMQFMQQVFVKAVTINVRFQRWFNITEEYFQVEKSWSEFGNFF